MPAKLRNAPGQQADWLRMSPEIFPIDLFKFGSTLTTCRGQNRCCLVLVLLFSTLPRCFLSNLCAHKFSSVGSFTSFISSVWRAPLPSVDDGIVRQPVALTSCHVRPDSWSVIISFVGLLTYWCTTSLVVITCQLQSISLFIHQLTSFALFLQWPILGQLSWVSETMHPLFLPLSCFLLFTRAYSIIRLYVSCDWFICLSNAPTNACLLVCVSVLYSLFIALHRRTIAFTVNLPW